MCACVCAVCVCVCEREREGERERERERESLDTMVIHIPTTRRVNFVQPDKYCLVHFCFNQLMEAGYCISQNKKKQKNNGSNFMDTTD